MEERGKQRYMVASQALELEHLQNLIRNRDREASEFARLSKHSLDQSRAECEELRQRNEEMRNQIEVLADRLRLVEADTAEGLSVSKLHQLASSSFARDESTNDLRAELRKCRNQMSSLMEEREILLEKLVLERSKSATLGMQMEAEKNLFLVSSDKMNNYNRNIATCDACVQTTDLGVATEFSIDTEDPAKAIELLKGHIHLEEELKEFHEGQAALHSSNLGFLHEQLQHQVQVKLQRLQAEQESYGKIMSVYASQRHQHTSSKQTTTPRRSDPVSAMYSSSSPPPQVDVGKNKNASPFFQQQEAEMLHLRKRLQDLQSRHDSQDGVKQSGPTDTVLSHLEQPGQPGPLQHSSILHRMLESATRSNRSR